MRQAFRGKTMKWEPRKYVAVDPRYDVDYQPVTRGKGLKKIEFSNLRRDAHEMRTMGITTLPFTVKKMINWMQKKWFENEALQH